MEEQSRSDAATYWDRVALELQSYRASVGNPSYAEIAQRIAGRRMAAGLTPEAARIARTTVYDAFRLGRKRIDLELHREIAFALGADDAQVDAWLQRARVEETVDAAPESEPDSSDAACDPVPATVRPTLLGTLLLLVGCVAFNLVGRELVILLGLSVHLDMLGTAVAAFALGPWWGAAVGVLTNLFGALHLGAVSLPFTLVNVAGALVWGYGVRRFAMGRTLPRFLSLNLLAAVACSAVAVPLLLLLYGGSVGHGQELLAGRVEEFVAGLWAVGVANLLTSTADKVISGFVALVVVSALPLAFRRGSGLTLAEQGAREAGAGEVGAAPPTRGA